MLNRLHLNHNKLYTNNFVDTNVSSVYKNKNVRQKRRDMLQIGINTFPKYILCDSVDAVLIETHLLQIKIFFFTTLKAPSHWTQAPNAILKTSSAFEQSNGKSTIFWDIMPCSPLRVNRRFGGTSPPSSGSNNRPRKKPA
jgi:hypothetical protein